MSRSRSTSSTTPPRVKDTPTPVFCASLPSPGRQELTWHPASSCRECGPFAEEGAFSPRYDSVRRSYCGVRAIQRAHAEAYLQFRQLRKILGFEGMDKAKSTPKSLARAYDGKYGFDFHSGMGYDKYSQMPVAIGELLCFFRKAILLGFADRFGRGVRSYG